MSAKNIGTEIEYILDAVTQLNAGTSDDQADGRFHIECVNFAKGEFLKHFEDEALQ